MLVLFLLLCSCLSCSNPPGPPLLVVVDHSVFGKILAENVRNERVDYLRIRRDAYPTLVAYLQRLARVDPQTLAERERLAFYINLYNASMIRAVVERLDGEWTPAADSFAVFDAPLVRLGDATFSLNHLEHEIIRPRFTEPRAHAALVCAARSCPPLSAVAYEGRDLDAVLEKRMKNFLRDGQRNQVDVEGQLLHLSALFDWYAGDFGGPAHITAYVGHYLEPDVTRFKVDFLPYSWDLNIASPSAGKWVEVRSRDARLAATAGGKPALPVAGRQVLEVLQEKDGAVQVKLPFGGGTGWLASTAVRPFQLF